MPPAGCLWPVCASTCHLCMRMHKVRTGKTSLRFWSFAAISSARPLAAFNPPPASYSLFLLVVFFFYSRHMLCSCVLLPASSYFPFLLLSFTYILALDSYRFQLFYPLVFYFVYSCALIVFHNFLILLLPMFPFSRLDADGVGEFTYYIMPLSLLRRTGRP